MKLSDSNPPAGTVRDWLDFRSRTAGDRVSHLFFDGGPPVSWAELRNRAVAVAVRLSAMGVEKGESVAILLPNGRASVTGLFGAFYGGFVATPINLVAGSDAIAYALDHAEARVALVDKARLGLWNEVAPVGCTALRADSASEFPMVCPESLAELNAADDALLMYTSGTTGRPKGVVHTQASLLAGGWTTAIAHALAAEDRALCILPIFHINGLCVTVIGSLLSGGAVAMAPGFSAGRFWAQCAESGATWFSAVPTIFSHLVHGRHGPDAGTQARIRFARSASAPLAPDIQTAFEHRFGIPIVETMGLTETAAQILSNPLPPGKRKIGSPGIPVGNEIAILSRDLRELPPENEGEIAVRGPNVMREYRKNPGANRAAFTKDGWFRSGDLGHRDLEGYVYVTGRLKEIIIKGGENIAPREIDEALYAHPDVVEAAAFPRACKKYGERVEAAVKLVEGARPPEQALLDFCRARVGDFKCPDAIHILQALPRGPSGKIQRLKIAEITARLAE